MRQLLSKHTLIFLLVPILALVSSCDPEESKPAPGSLEINFNHLENNDEVVFDEMRYHNAAGNNYEITEIQWFISDLYLITGDGERVALSEEDFAHYIDTNIESTLTWQLPDDIPAGNYAGLAFTFGLKGEKNLQGYFTDAPEANMAWPITLGGQNGGYHYMKLNGFWMNEQQQRTPFNFHLGVGKVEDAGTTNFVQNWFEYIVSSPITVRSNRTTSIELAMNVEEWFQNPNIYDHNVHGAMIMQNQEAMAAGVENGANGGFSVVSISEKNENNQ
jgi:hypothetical protein